MNIENWAQRVKSFNRLSKLPLGNITASGWLKQQLEREAKGMGGHIDELEPEMISHPHTTTVDDNMLNNIISKLKKSGLSETIRAGWFSETSGTYWTGLIQLAFTLNDENLKKKAEDWVNGVLAHQEADGYIGAYLKTDNRKEDYNAWGTNWVFRALTSYFEATRKQNILEACHRGLLWFVDNWKDNKTDYAGPTIIESMVIVYFYTKDERLLNWAEEYMNWLGKYSNWPNHIEILNSEKFDYNSMHTVGYGEQVKIPALLYCANGKQDYLDASSKGIQKILKKCFQRTGAPVSNVEYLGPVGSTCETEYCNFSTYANTFSWMELITGDAKYGDLLEKIVFNGAQGARKKDEKAIAFMTSPNQIFATDRSSTFGSDIQVYAPVFTVACCPVQSVRVVPEYVRSMCMVNKDGDLYFTGYGPCRIVADTIKDKKLVIDEITKYPFEEDIKLNIHTEKPTLLTINVRIPGWCNNATIKVNEKKLEVTGSSGEFIAINRLWSEGDVITLNFPMKVRIIEVDDRDFSAKKPWAIERGPLLFSLQIAEEWQKIKGRPVTDLPDGWSWYNVKPNLEIYGMEGWEVSNRYNLFTWNYAIDRNILSDKSKMEVIYEDNDGYPWEKSPVRIRIPAMKAKYSYPPYAEKTMEVYENPICTDKEQKMIELIPYGCTTLRISYFPVSKD